MVRCLYFYGFLGLLLFYGLVHRMSQVYVYYSHFTHFRLNRPLPFSEDTCFTILPLPYVITLLNRYHGEFNFWEQWPANTGFSFYQSGLLFKCLFSSCPFLILTECLSVSKSAFKKKSYFRCRTWLWILELASKALA